MILTDLGLLAIICYALYAGTRRGGALIALECLSFVIATVMAIMLYQWVGAGLKSWSGITTPLAHVAGFALVWTVTEVMCALLIRLLFVPKLSKQSQLTLPSQAGGAVLNGCKAVILIVVALTFYAGLPLVAAAKQPVIDSFLAQVLLSSSGTLQQGIERGLGHDLSESLNFFTVSSEPESTQRIDLGFTTKDTAIAPVQEKAMLELINRERAARDLEPLTLNAKARDVARTYSQRMLAEGYFSHIDPDGHNPFDRMKAGGVSFGVAGENLALAPTLHLAHAGLMNSPGHRANILSPNYHRVGIGVVDAGPYGLMITQNFTD